MRTGPLRAGGRNGAVREHSSQGRDPPPAGLAVGTARRRLLPSSGRPAAPSARPPWKPVPVTVAVQKPPATAEAVPCRAVPSCSVPLRTAQRPPTPAAPRPPAGFAPGVPSLPP